MAMAVVVCCRCAIQSGVVEVVECLLEAGASPNTRNRVTKGAALHDAALKGPCRRSGSGTPLTSHEHDLSYGRPEVVS